MTPMTGVSVKEITSVTAKTGLPTYFAGLTHKTKARPAGLTGPFAILLRLLRQHELNAGFYREVVALLLRSGMQGFAPANDVLSPLVAINYEPKSGNALMGDAEPAGQQSTDPRRIGL
jgi:hypothetical protein